MERHEIQNRGLLLVLTLLVLGGCGGDDPVAPESPSAEVLGVMGFDQRGGSLSFPNSLVLSLSVGVSSPAPALLFEFEATEDSSGSVITVDASTNPEFRDAVSLLQNGVDNLLELAAKLLPGGGGGATIPLESASFDGGISGEYLPDFAGARITHVIIAIDEISFVTPGSDPNGDGNWTDYSSSGRIVIMGHP